MTFKGYINKKKTCSTRHIKSFGTTMHYVNSHEREKKKIFIFKVIQFLYSNILIFESESDVINTK